MTLSTATTTRKAKTMNIATMNMAMTNIAAMSNHPMAPGLEVMAGWRTPANDNQPRFPAGH